jgi:hypothetical protein
MKYLTAQRTSQFRDAASFVEDAISERVSQVSASLEPQDELDEGAAFQQWETLVEQIEQLQGTFAQALRKALFASAWSVLERDLDRLTNVLATAADLKIRVADLSGRGVQRSHKYLERVANLDLVAAANLWRDLVHLNTIRNIFVHTDSEIGSNDNALNSFIERWPSITVQSQFIFVDEGFLPAVLSVVNSYWEALFAAALLTAAAPESP